jgi:peptidoglycan/xylan/chitin deacetylase (PgdA/CDA1 family)
LAAHELIELGAHTHTHGAFEHRVDDFGRDLAESVDVLRREFGITRPTFAFPFGVASSEMIEAARRTGVACALTTRSECVPPGSDPFGWGRYSADDRDTVKTLSAKLNGWYTPVADVLRTVKRPLAAVAPKAIGEFVKLSKPCFDAEAHDGERADSEQSARAKEYCEQKS